MKSPRQVRPEHMAVWIGVLAGFGTYATMRLLGERMLINIVVPVLMVMPLFAMALAPLLANRSWLIRPRVTATALTALTVSVATCAHAFWFPLPDRFPGAASGLAWRHGAALAVLMVGTPFAFLRIGRTLSEAFVATTRPAWTAAIETAGFCVGTAGSYACVSLVGGYEAFLLFVAGVATLLPRRSVTVGVVAASLLAGVATRVKEPSFFTWELASSEYEWEQSVWSPHQKLDAVTYDDCTAYMYNNYLFFYACPKTGSELNHVRDLSRELGKRIPVRSIVNLGAAAGLTPFTLLAAYPTAERYYAVEIESQILSWARDHYADRGGSIYEDPRVIVVPSEGRRFIESTDMKVDFIFVDGVDTPFITNQTVPVPSDAWFFTSEGYEAIFDHLEPDGYMIIEAGGNTPSHFAQLIQARPPDTRGLAVWYVNTSFPMVGMPHFWIALTKSEETFEKIREAFDAVAGAELVDLPEALPGPPGTDDRPIIDPNMRDILKGISAGTLAIIALVLVMNARRRPDPTGWRVRLTFLALGFGGTAVQVATITALSRGYVAPATGLAMLLCANLAGAATGGSLASLKLSARATRLAPIVAALAALVAFALVQRVWDPFVFHQWAIPAALMAGVPGGFLWAHAIGRVRAADRPLALGQDLTGGVVAVTLVPALLATVGYSGMLATGTAATVVGAALLLLAATRAGGAHR